MIFLIIIFAIEIYILKLVKGELKDKRRIKKTSFFKRFKKFFRTSEKREKKETKEERKKRLEKRRKFITFARKEAVRRRNIKEALGIKAKVEKRQALEDKEEEKRARERKKKIEEWKKEAEQRRKEAERKSKQNKRFEKLREKMGLKKKPSEFALRTRRIVDLMRK